jgi:hypothetical protein
MQYAHKKTLKCQTCTMIYKLNDTQSFEYGILEIRVKPQKHMIKTLQQ